MSQMIIIGVAIFIAGMAVGNMLTWNYMQNQWPTNPYKFKTIVENVIAMREERQAKERLER